MIRRGVALFLLLLLLAGCATRSRTPAPVPEPPPAPPVKEGPAWVSLEVRSGDGPWQPVKEGATYPRESLALRFQLHGAVDEAALRQQLPEGARVEKAGDDRLDAFMAQAPPVLRFSGVGSPEGLVRFYTGLPPQLVALDPATGNEEALAELPVDIQEVYLGPGGRQVLAHALASGPDGQLLAHAHLIDLTTGERWVRPHPWSVFGGHVAWWGDAVILTRPYALEVWEPRTDSRTEIASQGKYWVALSPEGRYLAGYSFDQNDLKEDWLPPATVVLFDLKERIERLYPGVARPKVYTHGIDFYLAFNAGGTGLLMEDHPTRESVRGLRLDRETGQVTVVGEGSLRPPYDEPSPGYMGWSYRRALWEDVKVVNEAAEEKVWGRGYTVGWLPDGRLLVVRWENADHRIVVGM